ncbi:hypothetical protein PHSY_007244 [Pseudozyma hubeiensis SY62]|uniref:Uncharacterized protein n=1 Tax=Pseudozyma hubeiensis (strain SY62) TaxID=1305764 RepID=R9PE54_PSEHS|nr:hypothetical protein PHSY_007244 [Pseudozyma hubeiensis SY62]GAC99641.1 hypothetical protein PHSY_007244 [Pseudozyma hubeiensis SY62]
MSQPTTTNISSHNVTTSTPSSSSSTSKAPTGIHPLLLSSSLPFKPSDSSIASTSTSYVKGKASSTIESNPYLLASQTLTTDEEKPKARSMHKGFQFHKPGRHVKEAEELRREQQMEELKKRIEQSARKAGLQDELAEEKRLLKRPPPEIEWWDENLLDAGTYDPVPDSLSVDQMLTSPPQGVLLFGSSSPIDGYVQHPIPIPSPSDSNTVQARGLMLTKREQRKLRRQRRAAAQQDKRDRIKMGLLPPEPPKVKLSNLMRVLTSEAVSDPTKIEARVRREIAARAEAHERHNADRKLTPDQRREKLELKKFRQEDQGLACQVYKVRHLISGRHKFKVKRNALDHALTGVVVFGEKMALIVVEGSEKALKKYKRLMTVRIDWTDPGSEREESEDEKDQDKTPSAFQILTTGKEDVDWSTNTCELIFEGPIRERNWKAFRARAADTDQAARDALGEAMQGYWDVAKRVTQSATDAF